MIKMRDGQIGTEKGAIYLNSTGVSRMKIDINVTDCRDCPFAHKYNGGNEAWTECSHPDNGREPYDDILWGCQEEFKRVPDWCPLGLQPKKINIKGVAR